MLEKTQKILKMLDKGLAAEDDSGIFGASIPLEDARIVLLPVPWDQTASYGKGASKGPQAILAASHQLDLYDLDFGKPFLAGIAMAEGKIKIPFVTCPDIDLVNLTSRKINENLYQVSKDLLSENKFVGVVGGDHSAPYGLIKALSEKHKSFGILHIDAHHDLRKAYEGYIHSHASIMYNVINDFPNVQKIVSVGIRDFSAKEFKLANAASCIC